MKRKLKILTIIFISVMSLDAHAALDLECNSCKKQIEGYKSNKDILEQKLILERGKEVINQDVISSIEIRVNEYNEKISELQDVLDICQGKEPKADLKKCLRFEKQIEGLELNVKILEQKISSENEKENPSLFVVNAAESKILELKKQIQSFNEILTSCKEARSSESGEKIENTVEISP